jgi:hypothetical protein
MAACGKRPAPGARPGIGQGDAGAVAATKKRAARGRGRPCGITTGKRDDGGEVSMRRDPSSLLSQSSDPFHQVEPGAYGG